ncbi:hypothetical protein CTA1_2764 [Colletotrichum tanaceti]|uniref:Uncharacterized protein n=1 Tax=Colletotrichum tanaceti TaxID=1306861 RepID=A0A4U6WZR8_9PEZI|nr:hypothetical protein CTA1_2764 [Colletotrichum tanaceti]
MDKDKIVEERNEQKRAEPPQMTSSAMNKKEKTQNTMVKAGSHGDADIVIPLGLGRRPLSVLGTAP